jgi:DNA transformation protein and related proteins
MVEAALTSLPNIGRTLAARLKAVGIEDRQALETMGPARAYVVMCIENGYRLPLCYYLYSLEGALHGVDWRCLSSDAKRALRRATDNAGIMDDLNASE